MCLYFIIPKILRKILKYSVRIDENPADEVFFFFFNIRRRPSWKSKQALCTCYTYCPSPNSLHRTRQWLRSKGVHGLGSTEIASQATRTKGGGQKTCLDKPLFKVVMNNNSVNFHRRRFIAAKSYSLRFPENGSLEQRANNNCQLLYTHRT